MDQSLKQRLVGAIVLVSLAIIFLPLVFDGQQQRINSDDYVYPDQPAMTIQSSDFSAIEDEAREVLEQIGEVEAAKQQQDSTEFEPETPAQDALMTVNEPATVERYIEQEKEYVF